MCSFLIVKEKKSDYAHGYENPILLSLSLPPPAFSSLPWLIHCTAGQGDKLLSRDPLAVSSSETPWQVTTDLQTVAARFLSLLWNSLIENKILTYLFFLFYFIFSDGLALLSGWRSGSLFLQFPLSLQVVSQPGSLSAGVTFLVITSLALFLCACNSATVPWTVLLAKSLYFISEEPFSPVSNLPELGASSSKGFSWLLGKSFDSRRNGALDASSKEIIKFWSSRSLKKFR